MESGEWRAERSAASVPSEKSDRSASNSAAERGTHTPGYEGNIWPNIFSCSKSASNLVAERGIVDFGLARNFNQVGESTESKMSRSLCVHLKFCAILDMDIHPLRHQPPERLQLCRRTRYLTQTPKPQTPNPVAERDTGRPLLICFHPEKQVALQSGLHPEKKQAKAPEVDVQCPMVSLCGLPPSHLSLP